MQSYSAKLRGMLRQRLIVTRSTYFPGVGLAPECPICGQPLRGAFDLHEALITRGDTAGSYCQEFIYTPCNVVLRHHICPEGQYHTAGHGGDHIFEKCARQIVAFEGRQAVRDWLVEMEQYFAQATKKALLRFDAIDFSGCSEPSDGRDGEARG